MSNNRSKNYWHLIIKVDENHFNSLVFKKEMIFKKVLEQSKHTPRQHDLARNVYISHFIDTFDGGPCYK